MVGTLVLLAMTANGEVDALYAQLAHGDAAAWHEAAVRLRTHSGALAKIAAGLKSAELAPEHARVAARKLLAWSVPYERMLQEAPGVAALVSPEVEKGFAVVAGFKRERNPKTLSTLEGLGECAAPAVQRLLESTDLAVKRFGIQRAWAYPVLDEEIARVSDDSRPVAVFEYDTFVKRTVGGLAQRGPRAETIPPPIRDFGLDLLVAVSGASDAKTELEWWEAARPQWQKWWQAKCAQPPLLRPPACR